MAALQKSKKLRDAQNILIAEGLRLCSELPHTELEVAALFYTAKLERSAPQLVSTLAAAAQATYEITEECAHKISGTDASQGIFALLKRPCHSIAEFTWQAAGRYLFLENISDPGNMGSLLRTAAAFGVAAVVVDAASVDIYAPKVVRAAMGAHFKLPLYTAPNMAKWVETARAWGVAVYGMALQERSALLHQTQFAAPAAVLIGNEANGLKAETVAVCTQPLLIPMQAGNESLGAAAAGAVALWELCKPIL